MVADTCWWLSTWSLREMVRTTFNSAPQPALLPLTQTLTQFLGLSIDSASFPMADKISVLVRIVMVAFAVSSSIKPLKIALQFIAIIARNLGKGTGICITSLNYRTLTCSYSVTAINTSKSLRKRAPSGSHDHWSCQVLHAILNDT